MQIICAISITGRLQADWPEAGSRELGGQGLGHEETDHHAPGVQRQGSSQPHPGGQEQGRGGQDQGRDHPVRRWGPQELGASTNQDWEENRTQKGGIQRFQVCFCLIQRVFSPKIHFKCASCPKFSFFKWTSHNIRTFFLLTHDTGWVKAAYHKIPLLTFQGEEWKEFGRDNYEHWQFGQEASQRDQQSLWRFHHGGRALRLTLWRSRLRQMRRTLVSKRGTFKGSLTNLT